MSGFAVIWGGGIKNRKSMLYSTNVERVVLVQIILNTVTTINNK